VPVEKMPFDGNILHLFLVLGVGTLFGNLCNKAGLLFSDHPDSPRTSMLKPVLQALMNTFRMLDNFTDIITLRILISRVRFLSDMLF
jgi:hypothetical protein